MPEAPEGLYQLWQRIQVEALLAETVQCAMPTAGLCSAAACHDAVLLRCVMLVWKRGVALHRNEFHSTHLAAPPLELPFLPLPGNLGMALKKSELYSSLWSSCDELRGGMDASQYKDYVLVLLFIKYISDKYAGVPYAPITIPPGSSFKDMVALKGKPDVGDQINKKIIAPLANANKLRHTTFGAGARSKATHQSR
jgi:hypothetical protein